MTLSELLFALVFIAVAVLAVVGIQIFALKAQQTSQERKDANLIATSVLWGAVDTLSSDFTTNVSVAEGTSVGLELDPQNRFTYQVEELPVAPPLTNAELRRIQVTVSWESKRGAQKHQLTTKVKAP